MFADDCEGISEAPEGLQKRGDTRILWEVKNNSKRVEKKVLVCNKNRENPVEFKWKWGEEELPMVYWSSIYTLA